MTASDDIIEALAASEALLRAQVDLLLDQLAELAIENHALRTLAARELTARIQLERRRRH